MMQELLIYGATGYTGRLIVSEALARGMQPVLAGRSRDKLAELARQHRLDYRVIPLEHAGDLRAALAGVRVVLNAAGPFRRTALPVATACLELGAHYLDISGEVWAIEALSELDLEARRRGCMLLPGAGFDVVPSDCMAAWVARRLPGADRLAIGLSGLNAISRGSAATAFDQMDRQVLVRRAGQVAEVSPGSLSDEFDFGAGNRRASAVSWGDVATAWRTTRIPNITVYFEDNSLLTLGLAFQRQGGPAWSGPLSQYWRDWALRLLPEGPSAEHRARARAIVVVRAEDARGKQVEVRLETPEVYSFTASTSIDIAERVLAGHHVAGFQTPAQALGAEYVLALPGIAFSG